MDFSKPGVPVVGAAIPSKGAVTSLSYHPDGRRLFAASGGNYLHVIDALGGQPAGPPLKMGGIDVVAAT